jgi:hypothetical protein
MFSLLLKLGRSRKAIAGKNVKYEIVLAALSDRPDRVATVMGNPFLPPVGLVRLCLPRRNWNPPLPGISKIKQD